MVDAATGFFGELRRGEERENGGFFWRADRDQIRLAEQPARVFDVGDVPLTNLDAKVLAIRREAVQIKAFLRKAGVAIGEDHARGEF